MWKIEYDRNGAKLILLAFIIRFTINFLAGNASPLLALAETLGVFGIIILVILVQIIYYVIKYKRIIVFSDRKLVYAMMIFEFLFLYGRYKN